MRGQRQSTTRQLNRHYQSGDKGRKVLNIYMHCNYPQSAATPGTNNSNILINEPQQGVIQQIEIKRDYAGSRYEEKLNHLAFLRQNKLFPLWYQFLYILGWDQIPGKRSRAYASSYYGYEEVAYWMSLYSYISSYKLINVFCGGFYGKNEYNPPTENLKIFCYFDDEHTRTRFYGPIWLPMPEQINSTDITEQQWTIIEDIYSKLHFWMAYPSLSLLFNPSTHTSNWNMYDTHNVNIGQFPVENYPGVFCFDSKRARYKDFMANHRLAIKIHLPITYDLSMFSGSPAYVREYQELVDAGVWRYNVVPISGPGYSSKVFIPGPFGVGSGTVPGSSSPWYHRTFREWMEVGEVTPICDIDISKTVEENARDFARTIV